MADKDKKLKKTQRASRRQKGAIIGLTIALLLAGGAAVATPLIMLNKNKGGGGGDVKTYKVTYKVGKEQTDITQEVAEGKLATRPFVPIINSQQVTKWMKPDGTYWNFENDKVYSDITLTGVWEDLPIGDYYTVSFFVDGVEQKSMEQAVIKGNKPIAPKNEPSKQGYKFAWWQKEGETTAFDFDTVITQNIKLNAKFDEVIVVTHKVTFHSDIYGTFDDGSTTYTKEYEESPYFFKIDKPTITPIEGATHIGWADKDGNDLNNVQITSDIDAYATYMQEQKYVNLSLKTDSVSGYDVSVLGTSSYSWNVNEHKTYGDIKSSLSHAKCQDTDTEAFEFKNWSKTQQTDFNTINPEPEDTYVLTETETLYPQFSKKVNHAITLNVVLTSGQHIRSGSQTIEVNYVEGTTAKTFSQITKPEIYEEGKTFAGYFKDASYTKEWEPDTPIDNTLTDFDIYVQMVEADQRPIVNFYAEEEANSSYEWVGNHENIKVETGVKMSQISIPNIYKDATPNPDPSIGFDTDYVFTNWYYYKDGAKVVVDNYNDVTISNSMNFYAQFEKKTLVTIATNEEDTPSTTTQLLMPSTKWQSVVKPDVTTKDPNTRFLVGWKAVDKYGNEVTLDATTKISDIKLKSAEGKDKETVTIYPIISNEIHTITFSNQAHIEGTESTTKEVYLKGNTSSWVDRNVDTKVNAKVNKPTLPKSDGGVAKNESITFNNKWEIKGGDFTDWTEVDDSTVIPTGTTTVNYEMRPVVTENVKVTFSPSKADGSEAYGEISGSISSIYVGTTEKFSEIFKPTINVTTENKIFKHWAKLEGTTYVEVSQTDKFEEDTTLYAIYENETVTSTVHFKITEADLNDPNFPADPISTEHDYFEVIKNHKPAEDVTVGDFTGKVSKTPTKKKHHFVSWGIYKDGNLVKVDPDKVVEPGDPLELYAMFEPDAATYHKMTIKQDPSKYTLVGQPTFYIGHGENMPIGNENVIEYEKDSDGKVTSSVYAWTVGKVLDHWETADGTKIDSSYVVQGDLTDIVPIFVEPAVQPMIKFVADIPGEKPSGAVIGDTTTRFIPINDTLSKYLAGEVSGWAPPTATKAKSTFSKWKILKADGTTSDYTADTRVTKDMLTDGTLTLLATFIDESKFEGIDGAYFYDTERQQWGAIQAYFCDDDPSKMKVQYQDDEIVKYPKVDFNYEIKFGSQTTSIPDYFMYGCATWNNGGETLKFPKNIKSIGKNVMAGCSSFNQSIESTVTTSELDSDPSSKGEMKVFTIGENFMKNCYLFDKDIKLNYEGTATAENKYSIVVGEGFMAECQSLGKGGTASIDLTGWHDIGIKEPMTGKIGYAADETATVSDFYSSLSTLMVNPHKINLIVSTAYAAGFEKVLINLDSSSIPYHRNIKITTK